MGHTLETYCKENGITYSDLAARSCLTPSYISMISNGKRTKIRYPVQLKLARALNLSLSECQNILSATVASSNLSSSLSSKRNSASFVPQESLELFYTLLENALSALHANNLPEFKSISASLFAQIPDTFSLKSNYFVIIKTLT
ncbi:MAG: helix-turn-helix domain-containing protein [Desulfitobacteriaceae bacterium]